VLLFWYVQSPPWRPHCDRSRNRRRVYSYVCSCVYEMIFTKEAQTRVFKVKPWKTITADTKFSLFIRGRDKVCQYPSCGRGEPLDCSHFFERGNSGTRFDPLNCIAFCREHHSEWEKRKKYEYKAYMLD